MAPPGTPTLLDRHSKRVLVDGAEWRDRLEQLAEMRGAASISTAGDGAIVDPIPAQASVKGDSLCTRTASFKGATKP
jgi:hypothetical protein